MNNEKPNIPQLRFAEFKGNWVDTKLGKVANIYDGTHQTPKYVEKGIRFVSVEDIEDIDKTSKFIAKEAFENGFKIKPQKDDILMTRITAGIIGATSIVKDNKPLGYYVSLALIRRKIDIRVSFLNHIINSKDFKHELYKRIIHVAFPKKINLGDIGVCEVSLPSLPQQQKIASFLTVVDDKISHLTQKKELLEQYKKGVMQKIFSQEIRFKQDDETDYPDWEENRLGKFVETYKGGAPLQPNDFTKNSKCEVIPKKAISSGGRLLLDSATPTYCTESYFNNNKNSIVDESYLITTLRDLVPSGPNIGYIVKNTSNKLLLLAQGVYGLKINKRISETFLIQYTNRTAYRRLMQKIMIGSTQVHIRTQEFLNIQLSLPSKAEQQRIADFLSAIDDKIEAANTQLLKTKEYKKGLLQQMFL